MRSKEEVESDIENREKLQEAVWADYTAAMQSANDNLAAYANVSQELSVLYAEQMYVLTAERNSNG